MSAELSFIIIWLAFALGNTLSCQQITVAADISIFVFRQEMLELFFVSNCQQNEVDSGLPSLAPARRWTEMILASSQHVIALHSRLSAYCRTLLRRKHYRSLPGLWKTGSVSMIVMLLMSAKIYWQQETFVGRIKLLTNWIADRIRFERSNLLPWQRTAELLREIAFINVAVQFAYDLRKTNLLNCQHNLLTHSLLSTHKFADRMSKFSEIINLFIEFVGSQKVLMIKNLADLDGTTTWVLFSHHANLSTRKRNSLKLNGWN